MNELVDLSLLLSSSHPPLSQARRTVPVNRSTGGNSAQKEIAL